MSLPEQLNIHSLFQSMTLFEVTDCEEPLDGADNEDASCGEHVPDLVWSNLTESNSGLDDHSHINDGEEDSIVSVNTSFDGSCSESHYETRLKATQKLINDCVITGKGEETLENRSPSVEEETFFPINVPARDPVPNPMVRTCFDSVHLLSPTYFASPEQQQKPPATTLSPVKQEKPSTLCSMIHPMSLASLALVTPSGPAESVTTSDAPRTVKTIRSSIRKEDSGIRQYPRLQSAFKSSVLNESIEYCLSTGKQGMSPHLRRQSRKLLPEDLTKRMSDEGSSTTTKENCQSRLFDNNNEPTRSLHLAPDFQSTLSILLLECHQKVFEIVAVDHVTAETSVGDVLSRARSQATDPRLSRQTYTSLCNSVNEMAAMMLPVHLMMDLEQSTEKRERKQREPTLKKYDRLEAARKTCDDLGRLLVAVPEGSSAEAVREIQKTLWCHPRVQRWWRKENRYSGKRSHRKIDF
jgi:hypothetical protein